MRRKILERVVQGDKVMQDFELESYSMGADHSQKVKAAPIECDYSSKDCVKLLPLTAVFKMISFFALLSATHLSADLTDEDYGTQMFLPEQVAEESEGCPFAIHGSADWMGKSKFEDNCLDLKDVQYGEADAVATAVFCYNPCYKEGALVSAGYTFTRIKWINPYFDQYDFNTVNVGLSAFTERMCGWTIQAHFQVNADIDHFKWADYLTYDIALATRYAYNQCLGLNFGFIALTGYKIDRLYPIIGFDWKINDSWQLNAVFPTNMSLVYTYNPIWSFEAAIRTIEVRHRVGKDQPYSRGLVEYRSTGAELGVNYKACNGNLLANVHAGSILGGSVKASNRHHDDGHRYHFGAGAPYVGGSVLFKF